MQVRKNFDMTQPDVASLACGHIEIQNERVVSIFFPEVYVFVCVIVVDTSYNLHKHKQTKRKEIFPFPILLFY